MSKSTIVISPSGNFYGSEQVLFDFLSHTSDNYSLYLPMESKFLKKIREASLDSRHQIKTFNPQRLYFLYFFVLVQLLFQGKKRAYVNEGGHIKWIKLLAKILPKKKFILHLRILEDVKPDRLGTPISNVEYIVISRFLENELKGQHLYHLVHDAYIFKNQPNGVGKQKVDVLRFGIIGRVALSKGVRELEKLFTKLNGMPISKQFEFHFYGDIVKTMEVDSILENIKQMQSIKTFFHGFVDKHLIYSSIDAVLHLNKYEPLGRIYFEALEHEIPIIGFKSGGIGELSSIVGDHSTIIELTEDSTWITSLIDCLDQLHRQYGTFKQQTSESRKKAKDIFSISKYVNQVSLIINQ